MRTCGVIVLYLLAVLFFFLGVIGGPFASIALIVLSILEVIEMIQGTEPVTFWTVALVVGGYLLREVVAVIGIFLGVGLGYFFAACGKAVQDSGPLTSRRRPWR